jgi:hypothetical protein
VIRKLRLVNLASSPAMHRVWCSVGPVESVLAVSERRKGAKSACGGADDLSTEVT